jgi:ubiquinone/menaquinone biosynthesis C-methylase UbiE
LPIEYVEIDPTTSPQFRGQYQTPSNVALPDFNLRDKSVLDIGCGTGKDLLHPIFAEARERCGIDVDAAYIEYGLENYPRLKLFVGTADALPFEDGRFDFVVSSVALLYANIPVALAEISRVTKPGGPILFTIHDWRMELKFILQSLRSWKSVLRHVAVIGASIVYFLTGKVPSRPWDGLRETFQTRWRFSRSLHKAGFSNVSFERTKRHLIVRARKTG